MMNKKLITMASAAVFGAALNVHALTQTAEPVQSPTAATEIVPFTGGTTGAAAPGATSAVAIIKSAPVALQGTMNMVNGVATRLGAPAGDRHIAALLTKMKNEKDSRSVMINAYAKELARAGDSAVGPEAKAVERLTLDSMKMMGTFSGAQSSEMVDLAMRIVRAKEHKTIMLNGVAKVMETAQAEMDLLTPAPANDDPIIIRAIQNTTTDKLTGGVPALEEALSEKCDPSIKRVVGQN